MERLWSCKLLWRTRSPWSKGRRRKRERQEIDRIILTKQQLSTCVTLFSTFRRSRYTTTTSSWNFKFHLTTWTQENFFYFFFLNLVTFLYNATPEKFIRAMNFETARILFLRNVFAPVVVVVIRELKMETFSGRRRTGLAEKAWN